MDEQSERRQGMEIIKKDVSTIITDVALIKNMLEANHKAMRETTNDMKSLIEKHNDTLYGNGVPGLTTKINEISAIDKAIQDHSRNDKYLFTTIISLLVFIIGKLFWK